MNQFLTSRFSELVERGALGIELYDALRANRLSAAVDVSLESPLPLVQSFQRAEASPGTINPYTKLPFLPKRATSLHALFYDRQLKGQATVRIGDDTRRFVPRRLQYPIPAPATAETLPNRPSWRVRQTWLYPGAAYPFSTGATGIRGRVIRASNGKPERWVRIEARAAGTATIVGRAFGDDRAEFLLLVGPTAGPMGDLTPNFGVDLRIYGTVTPPSPAIYAADPLADLPIEVVGAPAGYPDPVAMGIVIPTSYTKVTSIPNVQVTLGQVIAPYTPFTF